MPKWLRRRGSRALVIIVVCALAAYLFSGSAFVGSLRGGVWSVFSPVTQAFSVVADIFSGISALVSSPAKLQKENNRLREEVAALQSESARAQSAIRENEMLRREWGLLPRGEYALVSADVSARDPRGVGDWIMINKGESAGISKGNAVISGGKTIVGVVEDLFSKSSRVRLITNPESVVNVKDARTGTVGVVRGKYGLGVVLDDIVETDAILTGDAIITSHLSQIIPPGLLVGNVESVDETENALYRRAVVSPALSLSDVSVVSVIIDK